MSGGGSQKFTPTSTRVDPSLAPYRDMAVQGASQLYGQGTPGYFQGQNWVDPSTATNQALSLAQTRALNGSPLVSAAQNSVAGLTNSSNPAIAGYQSISSAGFNDPSSAFYKNMMNNGSPNGAMSYLQRTANGDFLNGNQFFDGAFRHATQGAQNQFTDSVNSALSSASAAGRYGSSALGNVLDRANQTYARSLNDTAGQLAYQNYASERGMQEAAIGNMGNLYQQDTANRMAGAQSLTQGANTAATNQLNALQGMNNAYGQQAQTQLNASQLAAGLANQDYADLEKLLQTGQIAEGYDASKLAGQMDKWNYETQAPYQMQSWYGNFLSGIPQGSDTMKFKRDLSEADYRAAEEWAKSQGLL